MVLRSGGHRGVGRQQHGSLGGRDGQHHAVHLQAGPQRAARRPVPSSPVRVHGPRARCQRDRPRPWRPRPLDGLDRRAGADGHPPRRQGAASSVGQAGRAVGQGPEDRGPAGAVSGATARRPARPSRRMRLPGWWDAAISTGNVAAALSSSTPPAWIPPTRGSTSRSTTGRPSRSPTISPTDRSPKAVPVPQVGFDQVPGHPERLRRAQDPRPGQGPPPGGDPEVEPVGHGPEPAPGPDGGARRPHRDQLVGRARARRTGRWPRAAGPGRRRRPGRPVGRRTRRTAACPRSDRSPRSTMDLGWRPVVPAPGHQLPGRGQPGDPAPDHGDGRSSRSGGHAGRAGAVMPAGVRARDRAVGRRPRPRGPRRPGWRGSGGRR